MSEAKAIKLFEIGCDIYAASNLREAAREYCSYSGDSIREAVEEIRQLTDEEMDDMTILDDPYDSTDDGRSFREQLNLMIERGERFPCAFASTEY